MLDAKVLDEAEFTAVLTAANINAGALATDAKGTLCSTPRGEGPGTGSTGGSHASANSAASRSSGAGAGTGSSNSSSSASSTPSSGRRLAMLTGGDAPELVVTGKLSAGGMGGTASSL